MATTLLFNFFVRGVQEKDKDTTLHVDVFHIHDSKYSFHPVAIRLPRYIPKSNRFQQYDPNLKIIYTDPLKPSIEYKKGHDAAVNMYRQHQSSWDADLFLTILEDVQNTTKSCKHASLLEIMKRSIIFRS